MATIPHIDLVTRSAIRTILRSYRQSAISVRNLLAAPNRIAILDCLRQLIERHTSARDISCLRMTQLHNYYILIMVNTRYVPDIRPHFNFALGLQALIPCGADKLQTYSNRYRRDVILFSNQIDFANVNHCQIGDPMCRIVQLTYGEQLRHRKWAIFSETLRIFYHDTQKRIRGGACAKSYTNTDLITFIEEYLADRADDFSDLVIKYITLMTYTNYDGHDRFLDNKSQLYLMYVYCGLIKNKRAVRRYMLSDQLAAYDDITEYVLDKSGINSAAV
jgi:hypothetical protein